MKPAQFVQELFDQRSSVYDEWIQGFWIGFRQRVDGEIKKIIAKRKSPIALLDIGCGTGSRLKSLLAEFPASRFSQIWAGDLSSGMMRQAKQALAGLPVMLFQGSMDSLPFADRSFEVVLALFAVLGCLPHDQARLQALRECQRVLKPGGHLILDVLSRNHPFYRENPQFFSDARRFKEERGWSWSEGDILVEKEPGRPSLNHGFDKAELEALTAPLFAKRSWPCYDTESGEPCGETEGNFLGILQK
jgi:ubiquinone/menaquinone biosynthesis C-methylase UbiE